MTLDNFKYNLRNLKKCEQYWDEMTPVPGGRNCSGCNRTIVDFSTMTYSEIAFFLSGSQNLICGYYLPEQLSAKSKSIASFSLKVGLSTLLTTAVFTSGHSQIRKEAIVSEIVRTNEEKVTYSEVTQEVTKDTILISGKVQATDSTSNSVEVLPFASVIIKGTEIGVACNEFGEFALKYAYNRDVETIDIVISAIGIHSKYVSVDLTKHLSKIDLGLINVNKQKVEYTAFYVTKKRPSWFSRFWRKITFR